MTSALGISAVGISAIFSAPLLPLQPYDKMLCIFDYQHLGVLMPVPYQITFTVTDADGRASKTSFYIGSGNDPAVVAPVTVLAADALIDGIISNVTYTTPLIVSGLKETITGQSDVRIGGRFIAQSAEGFRSQVTLPSFINNPPYVPNGSEAIDVADTDVAAFVTSLLNGATSTDNDLTTLVKAYEVFGGRR